MDTSYAYDLLGHFAAGLLLAEGSPLTDAELVALLRSKLDELVAPIE